VLKRLNILWLSLPIALLASPAAAQMRVDTRIQMSSGSCAGCDLSNKSMNGVRLKNANFTGSLFNNSNLSGGHLDGSNLTGAHFRKALMYRIEGDGVIMPGAVFEDATLTEANLPNAKLASSDFLRANLSRAVMTNTDFRNAHLKNANLSGAQLQGGQFQGAKLPGTIVSDADLTGADFSGADLSSAQGLKQAQLDSACGNMETKLPSGFSLPYCDGINPVTADHNDDDVTGDLKIVAQRLDRAIGDVETLLATTPQNNITQRTRLERIHSDLVQSKRSIER